MEAALLAIEGAPLRESAHRALIRALAAEGNRGEAMSRYAVLREMLDRELGVEPSFEVDDVLGEASSSESDLGGSSMDDVG
jgi:DNA-binding SARP family transcriptional activator